MWQYLKIVDDTVYQGVRKVNRTGIDTIVIPNQHFSHNMEDGFPLLTTKKMPLKTIAVELEGFIGGITSKKWFQDRGCKIWSEWSSPLGCPSWFNDQERKEHQLKDVDLGPIYGFQWRSFNKRYRPEPVIIEPNLKPSVCGVASYGLPKKSELAKKLKATWYAMIRRCYEPKDKDYSRYGGRGIYVVNRWLVFDQFLEDVDKLPGWDDKLKDWSGYTLDKDYYKDGCYGPNSCIWLSHANQGILKQSIQNFYAIDPCGNVEIGHNIKEFADEHGLDPFGISHCISGKQSSHKKWQFWRDEEPKENSRPYDQLSTIVKTLHENPNDRRMVCSAWNPNQICQMALPPCHFEWTLTHIDGTLNLHWTQRSCDLMLGVPFNIASYALLLLLLSKEAGMKP